MAQEKEVPFITGQDGVKKIWVANVVDTHLTEEEGGLTRSIPTDVGLSKCFYGGAEKGPVNGDAHLHPARPEAQHVGLYVPEDLRDDSTPRYDEVEQLYY